MKEQLELIIDLAMTEYMLGLTTNSLGGERSKDEIISTAVEKVMRLINAPSNKSTHKCDGCGKPFIGKRYRVYDEDFKVQSGLAHCKECAHSIP